MQLTAHGNPFPWICHLVELLWAVRTATQAVTLQALQRPLGHPAVGTQQKSSAAAETLALVEELMPGKTECATTSCRYDSNVARCFRCIRHRVCDTTAS